MKLKFKRLLLIAFAMSTTFYACKKNIATESSVVDQQEKLGTNPLADIKICTERFPDGTNPRGAVVKTKKWTPGTTLKVSLNGSTLAIRNKVIQFAREWEKYANIKFNFVTNDNTAAIRVSFVSGDGSWSYIGKDANSIASGNATMNFGWFTATTADTEYSRVVIHEFGHALGMIHEHQQPLVSIPWDKPAVYAYYAGSPNFWTQAQVDNNLFAKYSTAETNYSAYDAKSIMHYAISNDLTVGDFEVGWNNVLSDTDKTFIKSVYPF
ncbi:M12 family metallopeptidase [Pedobacter sp. GR22-10]|uniref:M12 family metallopeptidase n=1 Tax=Pedobacter sp. GR22-10 TaxID=2994472 RepID=UPI002245F4C1|nr:M12 family metallopeptidase [Pedobacter sp. GR22-10]MCX2432917.1 M12 family metallopeptidase [Pedobacter sp. GR22-10]